MNKHNYRDKSSYEFIKILEGLEPKFSTPQTANLQASYQTANQAYKASGLDPINIVQIPTMYERNKDQLEHNTRSGVPREFWHDFDDPIVYKINGFIYWYRGMNTSTGEGPKPELTLGIDLLNCEFDKNFIIASVVSKLTLRLSKCIFQKYTNNDSTQGDELSITSSQFKRVELIDLTGRLDKNEVPHRRINIKNLKTEELTISGVNVDEIIIDSKENSIQKIKIINSKIKTLIIKGDEYEDVELSLLTITEHIKLDSQFKKFTLSGRYVTSTGQYSCDISRILFTTSSQMNKGKYLFKDATIRRFELYGVNNNSILFKNCLINKINIEDFSNPGDLSLHNINNVNEINIKNSSMGKAELLDVDLSKPAVSKIISSNLLDVVLIDTVFPDVLTANSETDYKGIRDAFRQLKLASGKQGNRIQELKYEAFEMNAYKKDKSAIKTLDERAILAFNKWTNNHGQNWLIPLIEIFLLTIPAFILIKLQLGYTFIFGSISAGDFGQYFEFAFNPLHNFISVFGEDKTISPNETGRAKLIDVLTKIFSGLLIFQMIRAFRKYVK